MCGYGQQMLRGIISSDDDVEKSVLEVELTDTTFKRLGYFVLEQKNLFEIEVDTAHRAVNLLVSALGCSPYLQRVDFKDSKTIFLSIELQDCTQQIEEVIVKAKQSFIEESGDTLTFDADGFRAKTDLTLGDILSRMPGIEIDANRQILYQGKRVKQIWVEGRDILNNQHSLAIESLRAEDVQRIQIIHDYKPFHLRFSQEHSSDVAMNIGLTKTAQGRVNGKAELLAGSNSKYQLGAEALRARGKSGGSAFSRSNNIGTALIQPAEYLGLVSDFSSIGGGESGAVEVVPKGLLPDATAFEETQHLLSASVDRDIKEKAKTKAAVIGVRKNAREQADVETTFFDDNAIFSGRSRGRSRIPMLIGKFGVEYEASKDFLLSFDLTARFKEQQSNDARNGLYRQDPYFSEFASADHSWHHLPVLTVNMRHKPNWSSGHSTGIEIENQSLDLAFFEDTSKVSTYGQRLDNRRQRAFLSSFLENKHNIFLLEIKNHIEFGQFHTEVALDQLPSFENAASHSYNWRNWQPSVRYGIKTDRWMAHLQIELTNSDLNVSGQAFQRTWLTPLFRFKHSWHLTKFIGFSLRQAQAFIDQRNSFGLYQLYDNLQIIHYALEAGQSSRIRQASFYFFDFNKGKKSTINCTVNYQETTNAIARFNRFESGFIVSEAFLASKMENSNFHLSFSQPLAEKQYQWRANLRAMLTSIARGPLTSIDGRNLSFSTRFSSLWKGGWNAEWKGGYQVSKQVQGAIGQVWHVWAAGASTRYKAGKWSGNLDYEWQLSQIADSSVPLHLLGFSLDYGLNTWLTLRLFGQDMLNLNNSKALRFTTTPAFIEEIEYNRLQGSLMVGLKGSF
jgi:hypothetical protein